MAEYLIQDTTLDAIADAINAKTGGSSAMTPAQMVTAIGTIPSGGGSIDFSEVGETTSFIGISGLDPSNFDSNDVTIDVRGYTASVSDRLFKYVSVPSGGVSVTIIADHFVTQTYARLTGLRNSGTNVINAVTLISEDKYYTPTGESISEGGSRAGVKKLLGLPWLVKSHISGNSGIFSLGSRLEEVRIVPNQVTGAFYVAWSPNLSDETLISFANGLNADNANTITLNATPKARLETIVGTITHKTYNEIMETEEEFDFFEADENGTVTLMDFITNTKGWTAA